VEVGIYELEAGVNHCHSTETRKDFHRARVMNTKAMLVQIEKRLGQLEG